MSARAALPIFVLAVLGLPLLHSPSAAGPWSLERGEYYSEVSAGLLSTTSGYDLNGDREALDGRFEQRDFGAYNEFGWRKRLSVVLGLGGRSVSAVDGASRAQRSQTGITHLVLGLRHSLMNGPQGLALELDWIAPMGYDRELSPRLGDGRQRLAGTVAIGSAIGGGGFAQASAGYLYRFESFGADSFAAPNYYWNKSSASFFTASADAGWWVTKSVLVGGRYLGHSVLSSSGGQDGKDLEPDASQHLVGPMVLLRVDDRIDLKAGALSTAAGKNALHFDQFWIALAFKQSKLNRLQGYLGSARP